MIRVLRNQQQKISPDSKNSLVFFAHILGMGRVLKKLPPDFSCSHYMIIIYNETVANE